MTHAVGWVLTHHVHADFAGLSPMQICKSFLVLFFKKEQESKHFFFEKKKQKTFESLRRGRHDR
jgi:hypothetical protein